MNRYQNISKFSKHASLPVPLHSEQAFSTPVPTYRVDPDYDFSAVTSAKHTASFLTSTPTEVQLSPAQSRTTNHHVSSFVKNLVSSKAVTVLPKVQPCHVMLPVPHVDDGRNPTKAHRKYISCNNLMASVADHTSPIRVLNMAEVTDKNKYETEASSDADQSPSLGKIFGKYNDMLKAGSDKFQGNPEAASQVFQDFFTELSQALPGYNEPLELLGKLAKSLTKPAKPARLVQKPLTKHKVIRRMKTKEDVDEKVVPRLPLEKVVHEPIKKGLSAKIPKLNLGEISGKVKGFNEEFLEYADAFSESWLQECQEMKTINRNLDDDQHS